MQALYIALLITGLGAFFAIGWYLNKKTPLPEGCELPSLACEHCMSSTCSFAEPNRKEALLQEIKQDLTNSKEGEVNE
ncbi:MAG: hypothetical protein GX490_10430 [Bacilli bacterium]|nr:hypothetical protein [Bacilli bacterium]